jgi:hypothetical protein
MFDFTVTTATNLHLGPHELLAVLIPLATWGAWKSRHDLVKVATVLPPPLPA